MQSENICLKNDVYSKDSIIKLFSATLVPLCEMLMQEGVIDRQKFSNLMFRQSQYDVKADWSYLVHAISNVLARNDDVLDLTAYEINTLRRFPNREFTRDHCNCN